MIKEIKSIQIVDAKGKILFSRENHIQGSGEVNNALLSDFVNALQSFAKELGEEETKIIELGDGKIISNKDKLTGILFILKCNVNAKNKKMFKILNQIKNIFIEKFTGHFTSSEEVKRVIRSSFENAVSELINPKDLIKSLFPKSKP